MHDLTAFQRDLLYTIAGLTDGTESLDSLPHGLAIREAMRSRYETEIHHGRLYPNLDTLVEKGLIKKLAKDDRTNAYALTKRGQREIVDHVNWITENTHWVIDV